MKNVLAIARKELRSYFGSPIAYIVIGLFAVVFGFFFATLLYYFDRQSTQTGGFGGGPTMNVNEQLLGPVFGNMTVIILLVLPLITMRIYSEEKRSGTMELLLTAPITDLQIILGKFLGAMGLYGAMLAITLLHIGILFVFGRPEWKPIVTTYLGMLLMGGCFISVGLLISSMTRNQIVAGMTTFVVFLMLWIVNWISSFMGPTTQAVLNYVAVTQHLDDFTKGIVDTKHVVYYVSFIVFGLFLTARSVDTERWRG
ncbi:MAG TPA: ABC transporter permease [Vicinamibacterales bacterium]